VRAAELHRLARLLREIALRATGNTGADRVNAGELAVLEDVARFPGSTIRDITDRTGLAQSLVSRITRAMAEAGALTVQPDPIDRRRVRIDLTPSTRAAVLGRAAGTIAAAVAESTPALTAAERAALVAHLTAAAELLRKGHGDADRRGGTGPEPTG
jgi:DNA-binding MarR family transcriptional regulator